MKTRITIFLLIVSISVNGLLFYKVRQRESDDRPLFDPFQVNYVVTEKGLLADGYIEIPEDVPLLGKQIGDTLIYYQLNYDCDSLTNKCKNINVSHRFCIIYFESVDSLILHDFAAKYNADVISKFIPLKESNKNSYKVEQMDSKFDSHGTFYVKHRFTKQIFECHIVPASGAINDKTIGFELNIDTEFPWTDKQIEENSWIYGRY